MVVYTSIVYVVVWDTINTWHKDDFKLVVKGSLMYYYLVWVVSIVFSKI